MIQKLLVVPRSPWRRAVAQVKAVLSMAVLFSTLLFFNGLQILTLAILPFSVKLFRALNRWMANTWWGLVVFWTETVYRVKLVFSGDAEATPKGESAIVMANHQQMSDPICMLPFAYRKDRLGDMKWFVKDVLKYAPGVGWGMLFIDCLFLKRHWEQDKKYAMELFSKFKRENIPLWLTFFPEGTRIKPAKLEKSEEYAKSLGVPPFKYLLFPRTKGFVASVQGLRSHIQAVYDITIAYPQGIPTVWNLVEGFVDEVHFHIRRFPVADLPKDDEGLAAWLLERYREKDQLMESFDRNGSFTASPAASARASAPRPTLPLS